MTWQSHCVCCLDRGGVLCASPDARRKPFQYRSKPDSRIFQGVSWSVSGPTSLSRTEGVASRYLRVNMHRRGFVM